MSSLTEKLYEHAARMAERSDLSIAPSLASLPELGQDELDRLPFGVVGLDDGGFVTAYNRFESDLTGLAREEAVGRHFFSDLAPCTNNGLFRGTFERGVQEERLNHLFPYTFTYRMRPTNVKVHLYRDAASGTNWVLVARVR